MGSFEQFYPSEVARLVLGYLNDINCLFAWEIFLVECTDLQEHYKHYSQGKRHSTNVNGKSLQEILIEYCSVKYKIASEHSSNEKHTIPNEESVEKNTKEDNLGVFNVLSFASSPDEDSSSLQFTKQDTLTSTPQSISTEVRLENEEPALSAYNFKKISADVEVEKFSNEIIGPSTCNSNFSTSPLKRPAFTPKFHKRKSKKIQKCCKLAQTDNLSMGDKSIQTELELIFKSFHQSLSSTSPDCNKREPIPKRGCRGISEQENCVFNKHDSFVIEKKNMLTTPLKKRKNFKPKKLLTDSLVQERLERQKHIYRRELFEDMIVLEKLLSSQPLVKNICDTINKAIADEQAVTLLSKDGPLLQNFVSSKNVIESAMNQSESDPLLHAYMPLYCCRKDFCLGKLKQKSSTCITNSETTFSGQPANIFSQNVLSTDVPVINCADGGSKETSNFESDCCTSNEVFLQNKVPLKSNTMKNILDLVPNNIVPVTVDKGLSETRASVKALNFKDNSGFPLPQVNSDSCAKEVSNVSLTVLDYSVKDDVMSISGTKSLSSKENSVLLTNAVASENTKSLVPSLNIAPVENIAPMENIMTGGSVVPVNTHTHMIPPMQNIVLMDSIAPLDNITCVDSANKEKFKFVPIGVPFKSEMMPPANQLLQTSNLIPESVFLSTNQNASVNNLIMNNGDNDISNLMFSAFPTNNGIFSSSNPLLSQVPYSGISTFFVPTSANTFPMQNNVQYSLIINPNINWNCSPSSNNAPLQAVPFEDSIEIQHDDTGNVDLISKETSSCVLVDQLLAGASDNAGTTKTITPRKSIKISKNSASSQPKIKLVKTKKVCSKKNLHVFKSPVSSNQKRILVRELANNKQRHMLPFPSIAENVTPEVDNAINLASTKKLRRLLPFPSVAENVISEVDNAVHLASIDSYLQEFCNESLKNFAETDELPTQIEIVSTQNLPLTDFQSAANLLAKKQETHSFCASLQNAATEENECCAAHGNINIESSHHFDTELSFNLESNVTAYRSAKETNSNQKATTKSKSKKAKETRDTLKKMTNANEFAHQSPTKVISDIKGNKNALTKSKQKKANDNGHVGSDHNLKVVGAVSTKKAKETCDTLKKMTNANEFAHQSPPKVISDIKGNKNALTKSKQKKANDNGHVGSDHNLKVVGAVSTKKAKETRDTLKKMTNANEFAHQSPTKVFSDIKGNKNALTKSKQKKSMDNGRVGSDHNLKVVGAVSTPNLESSTAHHNIDKESSHKVGAELSLNLESNVIAYQTLNKTISNPKTTTKSKSKSKKTKESHDIVKKMAKANEVAHQPPNKVVSNIKVTKKAIIKSKQKKAKENGHVGSGYNLKPVVAISTTDSANLLTVSTSMADEVLNAMQKAIDMKSLVTLEGSKKEFLNLNSEMFGSSIETLSLNLNEMHSDFQVTKDSASMQLECDTLKSICISEEGYLEKSNISSSNSGLDNNILTPEMCDDISAFNNISCKTKTCLLKSEKNFKPKVSPLKTLSSDDCHEKQSKEKTNSTEKVVRVSKRKAHISKMKSKQPSNKKVKPNECSEGSNLYTVGIQELSSQTQSPITTKLSSVKRNYKKSVSPRYSLRAYAYKKSRSKPSIGNKSETNVRETENKIKTRKVNSAETFEDSLIKKVSLDSPVSSNILIAPSVSNESESSLSESLLNATEQTVFSQELFVEESCQTGTTKQSESKSVVKPKSSFKDILKEQKILNGQLHSDSVVDFQPFLKKAIVVLEKLDEKTLTKAMYPNQVANVNVAKLSPQFRLSHENSQVEMDSTYMKVNSQSISDHSKTFAVPPKMDGSFSGVFPVENEFANVAIETKDEKKSDSSLKRFANGLFPKSSSKYEIVKSTLSAFYVENEFGNKVTKNNPREISSSSPEKSIDTDFQQSPLKCDTVTNTLNTMNEILPSQQLVLTNSLTKVSKMDLLMMKTSSQTQPVEIKRNKTIQISERILDEEQSNISSESSVSKEHIKSQPPRSPVVWKKRKFFNAFNASKRQGIDSQCDNNDLKSTSPPNSVITTESSTRKSILKKTHERHFSAPSSVIDFNSNLNKKEHIAKKTMISRPTLKIVGFKTPPKEKKPPPKKTPPKEKRLPNTEVPNWKLKKRTSVYSSSHVAAQVDSSLLGPKLLTSIQPSLKSHQRLSQFSEGNSAMDLPTDEIFNNSNENGIYLDAEKDSNSKLLILPSQDKINHVKSNHDLKVLCEDSIVLKKDILPQTMITDACKSNENSVENVKRKNSSDDFKQDHIKELPPSSIEKFVTGKEKNNESLFRENNKPTSKNEKNLIVSSLSVDKKTKKSTTSEEISPLDDEVVILCLKENKLAEQDSSFDPALSSKDFSKPSQSSVDRKSDFSCPKIVDEKLHPEDSSLQSSSHEDKELVNTSNKSQSQGTSKNDIIIDLTLPEYNSEEFLSALSAEMAKSIAGVNEEDLKEQIREYGFENLMNLLIKKE